jgi:hypothetical protein
MKQNTQSETILYFLCDFASLKDSSRFVGRALHKFLRNKIFRFKLQVTRNQSLGTTKAASEIALEIRSAACETSLRRLEMPVMRPIADDDDNTMFEIRQSIHISICQYLDEEFFMHADAVSVAELP